jgi:hypothetical protein
MAALTCPNRRRHTTKQSCHRERRALRVDRGERDRYAPAVPGRHDRAREQKLHTPRSFDPDVGQRSLSTGTQAQTAQPSGSRAATRRYPAPPAPQSRPRASSRAGSRRQPGSGRGLPSAHPADKHHSRACPRTCARCGESYDDACRSRAQRKSGARRWTIRPMTTTARRPLRGSSVNIAGVAWTIV